MRCEGHNSAVFRPEPVPPTPEEIAARKEVQRLRELEDQRLRGEIAARWGYTADELHEEVGSHMSLREWDEWQSKRWFRPFVVATWSDGGHGVEYLRTLSDPMLLLVHSAIGEGTWREEIPGATKREILRLGEEATWEVMRRGLRFPRPFYNLKDDLRYKYNPPFTKKDLLFRADLLSKSELRVLVGIADQVADYSCLGSTVRELVHSFWAALTAEKDRRGLPYEGLLEEINLQKRPTDAR